MGLELITLGLRVTCSTNETSQAPLSVNFKLINVIP